MARLFYTSKEVHYVQDLTKEYLKDVVGQAIYYYPVSVLKTQVHPIYEEAVKKIFDNPIRLDCLANWPQAEMRIDRFGSEKTAKIEVFVQARDLIDKDFTIYEGDFFTFADQAFEVASFISLNNIFGQEEYELGYKITGTPARLGQFDPKNFLPPNKDSKGNYLDTQVQHTFEQQRGLAETPLGGETGDVRQMRARLGSDMADIALGEGPRTVQVDSTEKASSFYGDDEKDS